MPLPPNPMIFCTSSNGNNTTRMSRKIPPHPTPLAGMGRAWWSNHRPASGRNVKPVSVTTVVPNEPKNGHQRRRHAAQTITHHLWTGESEVQILLSTLNGPCRLESNFVLSTAPVPNLFWVWVVWKLRQEKPMLQIASSLVREMGLGVSRPGCPKPPPDRWIRGWRCLILWMKTDFGVLLVHSHCESRLIIWPTWRTKQQSSLKTLC